MGLADREYSRQPSGRGHDPTTGSGVGNWIRGWSANAWIIAVCFAVFFTDFALVSISGPLRLDMGKVYFVENAGSVRNHTVLDASRLPGLQPPPGTLPGGGYEYLLVPADSLSDGVRAKLTVLSPAGQPAQAVVGIQRYRVFLPLHGLGHFSTGKGFFELQVWRLVTFQFLHADINHLILNMVGLFFFGPAVAARIGSKRYLSFFLACGIAGAMLYLLLNLLGGILNLRFAGLLQNDPYIPLVGASGGVFGVLMAAAYFARPGDKLLLFFVVPVPIKVGAYGLVVVEFIRLLLAADNAGGSAAHIGGALGGALLIRRIHLLDHFLDLFGRSKAGGRAARGARRTSAVSGAGSGPSKSDESRLDRLLDKVNERGLHSLTDEERGFLERMSKRS